MARWGILLHSTPDSTNHTALQPVGLAAECGSSCCVILSFWSKLFLARTSLPSTPNRVLLPEPQAGRKPRLLFCWERSLLCFFVLFQSTCESVNINRPERREQLLIPYIRPKSQFKPIWDACYTLFGFITLWQLP